jgi:hypothetical protein
MLHVDVDGIRMLEQVQFANPRLPSMSADPLLVVMVTERAHERSRDAICLFETLFTSCLEK